MASLRFARRPHWLVGRARAAVFAVGLLLGIGLSGPAVAAKAPPPNLIFILADDLGYGDLGCYGQRHILTPNLDRMAAEGMRFTQFYAGSTVCAPSRSVLMTGQHTGHTWVRGNAGAKPDGPQSLRRRDVTVAEMLQGAGYVTGLVGKWGLGVPGDAGVPNRQGFDYFYGFLSQMHAHNHYPDYLWRNTDKVPLANRIVPVGTVGAGYATNRVEYAGDLFAREALEFVERHQEQPFFLYLASTVPHANNERFAALKDGQEVPDYGAYAERDWPDPWKGQAAMITRLDAQIGVLLARIRELGLAGRTAVFFTSDNGPHQEGGNDPEYFDANGPHRGIKRDLTDGGIRVPFIASWPGRIPAGVVSDHVGYFGDIMATFAQLAGTRPPRGIDSISLVPTLLGDPRRQKQHPWLYWEFHERGFDQAIRFGDWKALRLGVDAPIQIYRVTDDPGETNNLANARPDLVRQAQRILAGARTENPNWPIKGNPAPKAAAGSPVLRAPPRAAGDRQ